MAFVEVLTGNGLTVEQWEKSIFETYIGKLMWKPFMGTSDSSVIQVKQDLSKKRGDALTLGIRGRMQGGQVTGKNKAIGNEGTLAFYNQRIVVDNVRRAIKIEDIPMAEQRTSFGVLKEARAALEDEFAKDLDIAISQALMGDLSTGKVQGRYLYGVAESNYNATHATAMDNVDNTNDKFSAGIVSTAKRKAKLPINAVNKIRPMKVKTGKAFEEWFMMVVHPYSSRDFKLDATAQEWGNAILQMTPRMRDTANTSSLFSGSHLVAAWDGVLIYEHDDLDLSLDGASDIQVAHNLFLGAQAAAVVWAQRAKFKEEPSDFGHDVSYELHEIRNQASLVYDAVDGGTREDNGIIHVFSAAIDDA